MCDQTRFAPPCVQVLVIKRMLVTTIAESTPEAEEPRRILGFFINR
jgi:hypothetical protein